MKTPSRFAFAVATILLIPLYFVPFWTISMKAPQFPEGIGMYIAINDVYGHRKHDITSINILNHYIGMKEISVADIPEIKIMPWIFAILIALGLITSALGNYNLGLVWLGLLIILSIAGFIDYYLWGYEYGHNLSPDAPIKVPGMSYQPPIIGTKQLLNIKASSWPYWGFLYIAGSLCLASLTLWYERLTNLKPSPEVQK